MFFLPLSPHCVIQEDETIDGKVLLNITPESLLAVPVFVCVCVLWCCATVAVLLRRPPGVRRHDTLGIQHNWHRLSLL